MGQELPNQDADRPGPYRFGDVEVDAAAHTLKRGGEPRAIEPKAFAVLLALLRRPGELVGRDELLDRVWGHRHVTPGVLTRAIAQLRNVLGDDPHHPRYIQTRHALGYCFVGELFDPAIPAAEPQPVPGEAPAAAGTGVEVVDVPAMPSPPAALPARPGPVRKAWRGWLPAAAAVAAAALAAFLALRPDAPLTAEPTVAVMPFANLGPDRDTDYFAQGLAVEMHDALAGVPGLRVAAPLPPADGQRDEDLRGLGRRLGVAAVLDASVRREGDRIRINARLSDTASGYTLWSRSYERDASDVFATQGEIANEVARSLLGAMRPDRDGIDRRLAPTRDYAAFDAYLRGRWLLQHADAAEDADRAIALFNDALARDGGFARAQAAICRGEAWRFVNMRDAGAYGRALSACERAARMDPDLAEVDLELGRLWQANGDAAKAGDAFRRAARDPALLPDAHLGLGQLEAAAGRPAEALAHYDQALALQPGNAGLHGRMVYQQYLAGRIDEAIASYRRAVELRPDHEGLWSTLGGLHLASGDHAAARSAFERSIAIRPTDAALSNYGELLQLEGDYAAAASLLRQALDLDDADFLVWGNLGNALLAQPATRGQAAAAYAEAASRAERYLQVDDDDAHATAALGWYLLNLGDRQRAVELAARGARLAPANAEVALLNAQTLAGAGDAEGARRQVAVARGAGLSPARLAANPFLTGEPQAAGIAAGNGTRPPGAPSPRNGANQGAKGDDTQ